MRYGYLSQSNAELGQSVPKRTYYEAITELQKFARIKVTGELDEDTAKIISKPRCGRKDVRKRTRHRRYDVVGKVGRWRKKVITYRLVHHTQDISLDAQLNIIRNAFAVWQNISNLMFKENTIEWADIVIKFVAGQHSQCIPFSESDLAHAFYPGSVKGGEIHFDDDRIWVGNDEKGGLNLKSVLLHEIGHTLGLGHSNDPGSIMSAWYTGLEVLGETDIKAIQSLYGKPGDPFPIEENGGDEESYGKTVTASTRVPSDKVTWPVVESGTTEPPDPCQKAVDAVGLIRNELWLFIENWCWRIDRNGVRPNFPMKIERFWRYIPNNIDAVLSPGHGDIYFFKGHKFWRINSNSDRSDGEPLTNLAFPSFVRKIDAAFIWSYNEKAYFFTGNTYWRFDASTDDLKLDEHYPRLIKDVWQDVPTNLDAVYTDLYGKTHFVKDFHDYLFRDPFMRVKRNGTRVFGSNWFQCRKRILLRSDFFNIPGNNATLNEMHFFTFLSIFLYQFFLLF
ncbi:DgyrCDS9607 [Dimorphilus gyrociliatus]|uniref:DgyrCDS9607 n=1 Tax=Dimorphilus gyrociliatus TaxID=2664684 RepID=A0A7I8VZP1_9ANNE|nr:DgyrCDS9607 [Dimorphilus gyrociliatus]